MRRPGSRRETAPALRPSNLVAWDRLRGAARALRPPPLAIDGQERWRSAAGAALGILVTALVSHRLAGSLALPAWLVAPIGASAVIVFVLPSSPLARPWSVIVGNTLSALVGAAVVLLVPELRLAAGLAVGGAIVAMMLARCLHPPGAAVALLTVLSHGAEAAATVLPVLMNSVLLVLSASAYNALTRRPATDRPAAAASDRAPPLRRFAAADLDAALARCNQVIDVNREDLETLLYEAESIAWQRTLGALRCDGVMSAPAVTVGEDDDLSRAWQLLHAHSIKALPVVRGDGRLSGIVTLADLVRNTNASERVSAVMTAAVRSATGTMRVLDLLPLFSEGGHHHLPVVDRGGRPVGMVTQSDVIRALHGALG